MLIWIILVSVAILLQTTVFSYLKLWGVKPDLIIMIVLYAAFRKGPSRGATVGFIGGIIEDISCRELLGPNAMAKLITGFLFGLSKRRFFTQSTRFQIVSTFLATILSQLIFFLLFKICGAEKSLNSLRLVVFPVAGYNAILAPFVFLLLRKIIKKRYDRTKPD